MFITTTFVLATVILLIIAVVQQGRVTIAKRILYNQDRQILKERKATVAILSLSGDAINTDISDDAFLTGFISYAERAVQGSGAAILTLDENNIFHGCAIAGTFPPLREIPTIVEQQLLAHPKKHIEFFKDLTIPFTIDDIEKLFIEKDYVLFYKNFPEWIPKRFEKLTPRLLISPIKVESKIVALVMIVSRDEFDMHKLSQLEGEYLVRLNEIATLSLKGIRAFREKREQEERIQTAREEGMLQVSAGIIHNIGNAVTIAKLTVHDLSDKIPDESKHPEYFILNELLPAIEKHVTTSSIQDFLTTDESGKQYLAIIKELLNHMQDDKKETTRLLKSLNAKLNHISEIIELQQRFVGELGTENMTSLASVIQSSIKIFEETCNRHSVELTAQLSEEVPQLLIDSSMMTQVFMNLIKNAVEAMDTDEKKKKHTLLVKLYNGENSETGYAIAEITDNGPGMDEKTSSKIFNFGFSTKDDKSTASRGFGLHSCVDTIEKYGGKITVSSELDKGTTFKIIIPTEKGIS